MKHIPNSLPVTFREVLRRVLLPLVLFGIVLLVLLLLSWALLLPRFTSAAFQGKMLNAAELQEAAKEEQAKLTSLETRRAALVLPLDDSPYGALVAEKMSVPSLPTLFEELSAVSRTFLAGNENAVLLTEMKWDGGRHVTVSGDVRNVGLQSMAVLAQFVDAAKGLPGVLRADFPSFEREQDPAIGFHSPFTFTLTLR